MGRKNKFMKQMKARNSAAKKSRNKTQSVFNQNTFVPGNDNNNPPNAASKSYRDLPNLTSAFNFAAGYKGDAYLRDTHMRVSEVLSRYYADGRDALYRSTPSPLKLNDLKMCLAYASHFMPSTPHYKDNAYDGAPVYMMDENMSYLLVPDLLNPDFKITHVKICKLGGTQDHKIWQYAKDNKIKVILTCDNDFISIAKADVMGSLFKNPDFDAVKASDIPLVVHLCRTKNADLFSDPDEMKKIFPEIWEHAKNSERNYTTIKFIDGKSVKHFDTRHVYSDFLKIPLMIKSLKNPIFDEYIIEKKQLLSEITAYEMPNIELTATKENADAYIKFLAALKFSKNNPAP
jgi:hypothetical protein